MTKRRSATLVSCGRVTAAQDRQQPGAQCLRGHGVRAGALERCTREGLHAAIGDGAD
eukprot:CAMPEP_0206329530 /NCGR_PEP_ID=MMETSP0106_2-20121207/23244_1 /ASSEMBLY_ACC=CAM_ASM_000206 /TAXON_ID=81532 /ORGANISM="Acanthoeca-like sp., Strain 10tr" /LENGTH=56 /DNA_ID=CAMNT_0053762247 /DNA_START=42 /DNA_END=210 /DNA_ORIENTATION=+